MSNQRETRWIKSCIRASNIAQKCIELKINIMPYVL
jgi:hypothetical protein